MMLYRPGPLLAGSTNNIHDQQPDYISMVIVPAHCMFINLTIRLNDFGPLGPAFRGRDNIEVVEVTGYRYRRALLHQQPDPGLSTELVDVFGRFLQACRKAQPMTVQPSLATITYLPRR
jgi:hypothetical protein